MSPKSISRKKRLLRLALPIIAGVSLAIYTGGSVLGAYILTTSSNRTAPKRTPAIAGLKYQAVSFPSATSDGLKLQGWWIANPQARRALVLVHVKNGNRDFPLDIAQPLYNQGYSLLLFDLRGHGQSEGDHYSYGQFEQYDVVGAVNFVKGQGYPADKIGAIGWSMGAASTLLALSQLPDLRAVVSDSSYGDLARVGQERLGWLGAPLLPGLQTAGQLLFKVDFEAIKPEHSLAHLNLGQQVLLIHGDHDTTVPVSEVYHLQAAGGSHIAGVWVLPGVEHAGAFWNQPTEYLKRVTQFFDQALN